MLNQNLFNIQNNPKLVWLLLPLTIFEIVMKGITLWKSANGNDKRWFVAILIINSLGILPIIYLLTHKTHLTPKKN
jgi:hypothetical protein